MDTLNCLGRTRDPETIGSGQPQLNELAAVAATAQGQFEFVRAGVPGLYVKGGEDFIGQTPGYGKARHDEYYARDYHQVSVVIQSDRTMDGGSEDVQLLWQVGNELKAVRDFSSVAW